MNIFPMCESDLPRVLELAHQLGYTLGPHDLQKRFSELRNHPDYAFFVAKNEQGSTLGWIQVNRDAETLLLGPRADIAALIVDELSRGQKIGQALVKAAEGWAREKGLLTVRVRSGIKRERAHKFYDREGYELLKTGHTFQKVLK